MQLALSAFEDIGSTSISVASASNEIGYWKNETLINVSALNLLARKIINVCHFVAAEADDQDIYTMDLKFFYWMTGHKSRDRVSFKEAISAAQQATVQVLCVDPDNPENEFWGSVQLLGSVSLANNQIKFKLDSGIRRTLKKPDSRAFISMRVQAAFTGKHTLTLYEHFCRLPRPCWTDWITIEEFKKIVGVAEFSTYDEYKFVNRDILARSIPEINKLSDIKVEFETAARGSKSTTHIRFYVKSNENYTCGDIFERQRTDLKLIYDALTGEFGLSDKELTKVMGVISSSGEAKVFSAIEFSRQRIDQGGVKYPGKFLMSAIEEGRRLGSLEVDGKKIQHPKQKELLSETLRTGDKQMQDALFNASALIGKLPANQLSEHWRAWTISLPGKTALKSRNLGHGLMEESLEDESIKTSFGIYLSKHVPIEVAKER